MVAPAGVNEGSPQEPAKAGAAPVEFADAPAAEAEPAETVPAETVPAETVPAETVPAETVPAETVLAAVVPSPAEPAEGERAAAPEAGLAEAGPQEAEPAEAGGPGWDAEEAEEKRRDVSPLAVAGIIFGILALVGAAVGVLAVVTHGFRPKTVITYRPAAVFGLRPGQCIDSGGNGLTFTVLSCAAPHDAEVFARFSLPAAAWPGDPAVQQDAGNGCASRLASYLNPQLATAALTQEYVYPDQAAWQAGERTVVCEVRAVSGPLTGSVRA
jgi:Septum formation